MSLHVQLADMCGASCVRGQGCMPLSQLGNGCPVCCKHTHTHIYTHRHRHTHIHTLRQRRGSARLSCPPKDEFLLCLGKRMWSHSLKIQPMSLATHDLIQASPLCRVPLPLLSSYFLLLTLSAPISLLLLSILPLFHITHESQYRKNLCKFTALW